MRRNRIFQLAGLALLIMLFVGADSNQRFDKLGHRMMCQCGCNQVLLECNHVGCTVSEKMRAELQVALGIDDLGGKQNPSGPQSTQPPRERGTSAAGTSDDAILQGFVAKYGPVVLAAPTATGFNRVAWVMPYMALLGGFLLVGLLVKRWNAKRQPVIAAAAAASMNNEQMDEFRRRARQETEV